MNDKFPFRIMLSGVRARSNELPEVFALLSLGLVQSLASGTLSPSRAVEHFHHAGNCLSELEAIRSSCLKLLRESHARGDAPRATA